MRPAHQGELVTCHHAFEALAPAWDALFTRAREPYPSQSWEWTRCAWDMIARPRGAQLCIVVVRSGDRLSLVWPMLLKRRDRLWWVASPLGTTEYADVLVEDGPDRPILAELAWQTLRTRCGGDLIHLERVRTDSLLHEVLTRDEPLWSSSTPCPYVAWDGFKDFDAYWRTVAKRVRGDLHRRERRLAELGTVTFKVISEGERAREVARWMLREKGEWLIRKGLRSRWIGSKDYEEFFLGMPGRVNRFGQVLIFALAIDGRVIAAQYGCLGAKVLEFIFGTYDHSFARYAPGHVLMRHVLKWAHQRDMVFDLRFGAEAYKEVFATHRCQIAEFFFVNSTWGNVYRLGQGARRRLGHMLDALGRHRRCEEKALAPTAPGEDEEPDTETGPHISAPAKFG